MTTLTNKDRVQVINSRMKSLEYNKYNVEIDIIVENAKALPSSQSILVLNSSLGDVDAQIAALNTELALYPVVEEE